MPTPITKHLIDCHVHLAALPDAGNACFVSARMLRSPLFRFLLWKHDLPVRDPALANHMYVMSLLGELRASRHVAQAVLLGMDGVYDREGRPDLQDTDFLVSNEYVLGIAREHPQEFLAGVSINPQRRDAVDEVNRCADAGATLVKVLPNSQQFDPATARYKPFYRALAQRGLPLLSHVGYEFSLIGRDQSVGDPERLRVALDEGTTVIAAHGCSYGLMIYERFFPTFQKLVREYPRFYADISALTLLNRFLMLLRLRREPALQERLLFGTDYPLPVFHFPAWGRVGWRALRQLLSTKNRFDRMVVVCQHLGLTFGSLDKVLPGGARPRGS